MNCIIVIIVVLAIFFLISVPDFRSLYFFLIRKQASLISFVFSFLLLKLLSFHAYIYMHGYVCFPYNCT